LTTSFAGRKAPLLRRAASVALGLGIAATAGAQPLPSRNLAPGFTSLARDAKVVIMPVDVELFSLSAGGVPEPKADWTTAAHQHMKVALDGKTVKLGIKADRMDELAADEFSEQVGLHAAVARSIALHHSGGGVWALPTKEGKLDWSFGDAMKPLADKTGAKYALFVWVRDSYASAERKAAMAAIAILSLGRVVLGTGIQTGYASLVDLHTGQVVWFNRLISATGDLREVTPAAASVEQLMAGFPPVQ
jgi:hypothetical protein